MAVDDSYTKSLLHFNGADGGTVFTDESAKVWTAKGNAQLDTAQRKLGVASGLFDGSGDYITTADHADWWLDDGSASNKWTIDFWVRFAADPNATAMGIVEQYQSSSEFWGLYYASSLDDLYFQIRTGGANIVTAYSNKAGGMAVGTGIWYHMAVVRNGTAGYAFYLNGSAWGTALDDSPMPNFTGTVNIGQFATGNNLNGWLDEFRVSKGVARWTTSFTPPNNEYGVGGNQVIWFS
jgi:hypothetical protein